VWARGEYHKVLHIVQYKELDQYECPQCTDSTPSTRSRRHWHWLVQSWQRGMSMITSSPLAMMTDPIIEFGFKISNCEAYCLHMLRVGELTVILRGFTTSRSVSTSPHPQSPPYKNGKTARGDVSCHVFKSPSRTWWSVVIHMVLFNGMRHATRCFPIQTDHLGVDILVMASSQRGRRHLESALAKLQYKI